MTVVKTWMPICWLPGFKLKDIRGQGPEGELGVEVNDDDDLVPFPEYLNLLEMLKI